jgi:S-adenosylmethionine decarboxylase proenzyme
MGQKKPKSKKEGDEQIARRVKTANNQESLEHAPKMSEYIVRVSKRFVLLTMMSCMLLAFVIGRTARILLLRTPSLIISEGISEKKGGSIGSAVTVTLPDLVLKPGKAVPPTEYTSKTFDTTKSASMKSRWIVTDQGRQQCVNLPGDEVCMAFSDVETLADDTKVTSSINDDVVHLPAGQHLLVDIENVNGTFLNSEEILALAMLELIDECGLTLLSYHCHKMFPLGVSCAGILLESHISFHTWPNEGVITLDLYTCGPKSLLPIIPVVERLFAVPRGGEEDQPNMVWAHKIRGFESSSGKFLGFFYRFGLFLSR